MVVARKPVILVVDDDVVLVSMLAEYLTAQGLAVKAEPSGARAIERIREERPDLVILDVVLPDLDGFSVCRVVRSEFSGPIVMLAGRGEELDEIVALELGADDFLRKPVSLRRLLARVRSVLRRGQMVAPPALDVSRREVNMLALQTAVGELALSRLSREVSLNGQRVELTTGEFDTLWYLAERAGQIVPRDEMVSVLRGISYEITDRSLDIRVARLRHKLGTEEGARLIKTVRGVGYQLALASEEPTA